MIDGTVILDGVYFRASLLPILNYVSPWTAKFGAGDARFNDLEPASYWAINSFSGGLLKDEGDINEDQSRMFDSTAWTHFDGRPRISAIGATATIVGGVAFSPIRSIEHDGSVFTFGWAGAASRPLWVLSAGPTWTGVTTASAPADTEDVLDACVQGQDMFLAMGTTSDIIRRDGADTYSEPAASEQAHCICAYEDDTVVKGFLDTSLHTLAVEKSTDRGATWTASVTIGTSSDAPLRMMPFLTKGPEGGLIRAVVVGLIEGIWAIDVENNRAWPLLDLSTETHRNNCKVMTVGTSPDDTSTETLFANIGRQEIVEIHPEGRLVRIGLDAQDGLPIQRQGIVQAMLSTTHYLYVACGLRGLQGWGFGAPSNVYSSVFVMNKRTRTWHSFLLGVTTTNFQDTTAMWLTDRVNDEHRFYFWRGTINAGGTPTLDPEAWYIRIPVGLSDANELNSIAATPPAYVVTPKFNGGFFQLPKLMLSMAGQAKNLTTSGSTKSVQVLYMLDDGSYTVNSDTGFTSVGTYTSGPRTKIKLFNAGLSTLRDTLGVRFDNLRLKFVLNDTAASPMVGTGPVLLHWITDYVALPPRVHAWRLRLYNDPAHPTLSHSAEGFHRAIHRIAWQPTLVSFYPDADHTDNSVDTNPARYYVRISSLVDQAYDNKGEFVELVVSELTMSNDQSADDVYPLL